MSRSRTLANHYREIFQAPGSKGFASAGFVARLPIAMAPIGIVAMLSQTHGEYWLAGAVSATYALTNAVIAPQVSRLVDRVGQTRIVLPTTIVSVLAFAVLILAERQPSRPLMIGAALLLAGILLFCGGVYASSLDGPRWVARLAPTGGVSLIAAWLVVAFAVVHQARRKTS